MVGIYTATAHSLALLYSICQPSIVGKVSIITILMITWHACCLQFLPELCLLISMFAGKMWTLSTKNDDCIKHPLSWATKPGSDDTIWLAKTHWPVALMLAIVLMFCMGMPRLFVHSQKIHAEHFRILACVNHLGKIPIMANISRTPKLRLFSL